MSAQQYDDSVNQREGSISNQASAVVHDRSKAFIIGTLIALNVIATAAMYNAWRDAAMESRLKQYNLDWFKAHEFAELDTKVAVLATTKCNK
jgi:6-phosphogluconate dehydrogenase